MNLLASILIWLSVALGVIAATTAYVPTLDAAASAPEPLTLAAPAGLGETAPGSPAKPLVPVVGADGAPTRLTADVIATLREAGVARVRVKEFAFARWSLGWVFLGACGGLVAGTILLKRSSRAAAAAGAVTEKVASAAHPAQSLAGAIEELRALQTALRTVSRDEALSRILDVVARVQSTHFAAFISERGRLVGEFGMARFAHLMGDFAAGERQVNRAWSAAADGVLEEAVASLDAGISALASIKVLRGATVR